METSKLIRQVGLCFVLLDNFYVNVLFIKIDLKGILTIILVFIKWEMWISLFLKNVAI